MALRIKQIEPVAISLPMITPLIMAGEEVHRAENVLALIDLGRRQRGI